jgi:hypothetical protein
VNSFIESKQLYYLKVRVPKDEAYFVYFTLESNEGVCHFSTSDDSLRQQYRDIDINSTIEFKDILLELINKLQQEIRLDIMAEKITQDC